MSGRTTGSILLLLLLLLLIILFLTQFEEQACIPTPEFEKTETDGQYEIEYRWNYDGRSWKYHADVPKDYYEYFKALPRKASYQEYVLSPVDDEWMENIAGMILKESNEKGWDEWDTVDFTLSFVQNMPYTSDIETTGYDNYPRYPVETVVDGGGDCEDTSILFASILRELGHDVVLLGLFKDKHMAVGIRIPEELINKWNRSYELSYCRTGNEIWAFCETTRSGWRMGNKPTKYSFENIEVFNVSKAL